MFLKAVSFSFNPIETFFLTTKQPSLLHLEKHPHPKTQTFLSFFLPSLDFILKLFYLKKEKLKQYEHQNFAWK
jgi:hypothetical protein